MKKYTNQSTVQEGFNLGTQAPIDDRLHFSSIVDMQLTSYGNTSEAYEYYDGMVVYVIDSSEQYMWKESSVGGLTTSFTYPSNIISHGVDYSNKTYNFVSMSVVSPGSNSNDHEATVNIIALTPYTITIPASVGILDVSIYDVLGKDVSDAFEISITTTQITISSNINLTNITIKTIYKS